MFSAHHLELFYLVAKYGGISAAVRHIPYGIGQPAVSGQMADFENAVGVKLFERRPFQLTVQGQRIYEHIRSCHDGLPALWEDVRHRQDRTIRIAAAATLGPEILGAILAAAAPLPGKVRFELVIGQATELELWVRERRVLLAITPVERRVRRVCSQVLAQSKLRLFVPRAAGITSPGDLWSRKQITETLISLPETEPVCREWVRGLRALHIKWSPGISVESPRTMLQLVAAGQGVGVGLDLPWLNPPPGVRTLPLTGFGSLPLVMLWRKPVDPLLHHLLKAANRVRRGLWGKREARTGEG